MDNPRATVTKVKRFTISIIVRDGAVLAVRLLALLNFPKSFMGESKPHPGELLQGTLDMLILKTLTRGPLHGYSIAEFIQETSEDALRVEEGALYPALHRLELRGLLASEWGVSENNRRAKYYRLTAAGRKQLAQETAHWGKMTAAIARILEAT